MSDHFSLDDYDPEYDSVSDYHGDDDTPFDHKKSAADGAIEHRQKNKTASMPAPASENNSHMSKLEDPEDRESVSKRVNDRRSGEVHHPDEQETHSNDPADW